MVVPEVNKKDNDCKTEKGQEKGIERRECTERYPPVLSWGDIEKTGNERIGKAKGEFFKDNIFAGLV